VSNPIRETWTSPDGTVRLLVGDCIDRLKDLPDESVHCVVTSPPYWGLRDYGTAIWEGGTVPLEVIQNENGDCTTHATADGKKTLCGRAIVAERWFFHWRGQEFREDLVDCGRCRDKIGTVTCDHKQETKHQQQGETSARTGRSNVESQRNENFRDVCGKCGARRIDQQIGLEATPEEFVAKMVAVFREVRRVLRSDGTCWVNLGDSYARPVGKGKRGPSQKQDSNAGTPQAMLTDIPDGLKEKDIVGIPWRVAFALQADGWWLRQDIIWSKLNPMPESVTDRCTKAHEYVFLLTKSARYFYDAEAIKEPGNPNDHNGKSVKKGGFDSKYAGDVARVGDESFRFVSATRNRRSVWTVATKPYSGAHFATFPPDLITPCIKAGTSERGCCAACGAPCERVIEKASQPNFIGAGGGAKAEQSEADRMDGGLGRMDGGRRAVSGSTFNNNPSRRPPSPATVGWQPTCDCGKGTGQSDRDIPTPVPCTVLDPFAGSGTTLQVARVLGRHAIGCELSAEYAELAKVRSMSTLEGSDDTRPLCEPMKPRQLDLLDTGAEPVPR